MKRTKLGVAGAAAAALAVGLTAQNAVAAAPNPAPFCANGAPATGTAPGSGVAPAAGRTVNIAVAGTGAIRDVDLITNITHQFANEVELRLKSPAGTEILLRGTGGPGSYRYADQQRWDDDAGANASRADLSAPGGDNELVPEGAMGAFIGESAAGTWVLTVTDTDPGADPATLGDTTLEIQTVGQSPAAPASSSWDGGAGSVPGGAAPSGSGTVVQDIVVSGQPRYLTDVNLFTAIEHELDPSEITLQLQSPAGTTVVISDRRGSGSQRSLTTTWDDSADTIITRATWSAGQTRASLVPEAALAAFIGEDPNGTWRLTAEDAAPGDGFDLTDWDLNLAATNGCGAPPPNPPAPNPPTTPPVCVKTNLVASILGQKKAIRGKVAAVKIRVRNATAGANAGKTSAKFTLPVGFTLSSKPTGATLKRGVLTIPMGTIAGGTSKTVTIKLKAKTGASLGVKRRTVTVRANCGSADTAKLAVTVARAPR